MNINLNNIALRMSAGRTDQFPTDGRPQIILSGRSNVGKSSLINTLLGRKALARVSSSPGKTITINFYDIDGKIYFVDLPGYGFAARKPEDKARWSTLTDAFLNDKPQGLTPAPRLIIQLIDSKAGATDDDLAMIDWMQETLVPCIYVATKIDRLNKTNREKQLAELRSSGAKVIPFSALTGEGRADVWNEINNFLNK